MLNSCDFQGRFAADPELRTTQTGKQVASFRMAVDRDMVDANGHRPTDWLTFTAWGKTAEFVSRYFRKGSAAVVHSRCQTRQYEDKNGNNRTAIEFVVDNIYFAGPKQDNQQGTVDDGGTNPPPATYRNQQPQPQQMGFATQSQRQQWQGAADHPGNVQVSQSFSQGSDDDFSVLDAVQGFQPDPDRQQDRLHRNVLRQLGRPDDRRSDGSGDIHHSGRHLDG